MVLRKKLFAQEANYCRHSGTREDQPLTGMPSTFDRKDPLADCDDGGAFLRCRRCYIKATERSPLLAAGTSRPVIDPIFAWLQLSVRPLLTTSEIGALNENVPRQPPLLL